MIVNGNQFLMDGGQVDLGTTLKKAVIIGNVITVSQCFSLCDRKLNLTGKSQQLVMSYTLVSIYFHSIQGPTRITGKAVNTQIGLNADDSPH